MAADAVDGRRCCRRTPVLSTDVDAADGRRGCARNTAMGDPSVLSLRRATVYRGSTRVFDRLDLDIPSHCSTAVLGPNGAGKSTLLQLVTRDVYPAWDPECRVSVLGRERWHVFDLRDRIGVVSHELCLRYQREVRGLDVALSGLYSSVGVYRNHTPAAHDLERAASALARLGAAHLSERSFTAMSAGEQRRCLLARALINEPEILLLDEPTASLDLRASFELLTLLEQLLDEGRRLVLVTHHLQEIPPAVQWVVLLRAGRVLAAGPKEEMLSSRLISELFDVPVVVVAQGGFYQVLPAPSSKSARTRASSTGGESSATKT
jgi:iron complex transport system ATP-binding protein